MQFGNYVLSVRRAEQGVMPNEWPVLALETEEGDCSVCLGRVELPEPNRLCIGHLSKLFDRLWIQEGIPAKLSSRLGDVR